MVMVSSTVPLLTSVLSTEDLYLQLLSISMKTGCKVRKTVFRKFHQVLLLQAHTYWMLSIYISCVFFSIEYQKYADVVTVISIAMVHKKTKAAYLCTIPHLCRKLTAKIISAE